jgi:hypothetical protein
MSCFPSAVLLGCSLLLWTRPGRFCDALVRERPEGATEVAPSGLGSSTGRQLVGISTLSMMYRLALAVLTLPQTTLAESSTV